MSKILMTRRDMMAAALLFAPRLRAAGGETLYNGIRLPDTWPPRDVQLSNDPLPEPGYLLSPPDVIPIDTGRQLFVDDFLVQETTLRRTFHRAQYYFGNPVLKADRPWEFSDGVGKAMPFSDGVFYDPDAGLYKIWYMGSDCMLHATSRDGVHWDKPAFDVRKGTNIVHLGKRDSATVWLDSGEKDARKRYKFLYSRGHMKPLVMHESADGVHWGEPVGETIPWSDRATFFKNPFRNVWVFSLRDHDWTPGQPENREYIGRLRKYWESPSFEAGLKWKRDDPVLWVMADRLDPRRIDLNVQPQLYNLDAVAYESVLLGLFSIWRGQPPDRDKPNEITAGFSRDGFHWWRPDRRAFIPVSEQFGDWNYCNVQSAGGCCLVTGDRLYFYVSGRGGARGVRASGNTSTGLATLRRDGFASMDAGDAGQLLTHTVRFSGKRLFVNVNSTAGEFTAEVTDAQGRAIPPFTHENCLPVRADNTLQEVNWRGGADLAGIAGKPVRFRFHLRAGSLYAFWVAPDANGASMGYAGAGGPGIPGIRDTAGAAAYRTCCKAVTW